MLNAEKIKLTESQIKKLMRYLKRDIRVIELRKNQVANGGLNVLERIMLAQIVREAQQELGFNA